MYRIMKFSLFVLAPTLAQQLGKPMVKSPGFGLQNPFLARGYQPQRWVPAMASLTPEQEAFMARKRGETGFEGVLDTHGRASPTATAPAPASSGGWGAPAPAPAPASGEFAGMTQDQIDFIKRKRGETGFENVLDTHGRASPTAGGPPPAPPASSGGWGAPAPAAPASASGEFAGMTQDQIDFIKRKRGETGFENVLDTHGRASPTAGGPPPASSGGWGAPAPPAPISGDSGPYAGMTPDQIEFMRRKRGEIGMTGGLDTHGRPRLAQTQGSPIDLGILAVGLLSFFVSSAVTFAVFRRSAPQAMQPLLTASR